MQFTVHRRTIMAPFHCVDSISALKLITIKIEIKQIIEDYENMRAK